MLNKDRLDILDQLYRCSWENILYFGTDRDFNITYVGFGGEILWP